MRQKLFDIYLRIFLLGTMVFYVPGALAYVPQEKFFQFGAMGFLGISLIVPARRIISNAFLGVLFLYILGITLLSHFTVHSIGKLENIMFGVIVIKTIAERVNLDFKKIGNFFLVFMILNILMLSLQVLNIDPIFTNVFLKNMTEVDQTGFLSARFALASVGALMLPFAYAASPLSLLAVVPLLWFGKSSSCILASALAVIILISKGNRKKMAILGTILGITVAGYAILVDSRVGTAFGTRFPVWLAGISGLKLHPWVGMGLGEWLRTNFVTQGANGVYEQWTWAHNDFLQLTFEVGVAGLVILWIWLKDLIVKCKDKIAIASFVTLFIIAFFHFPFHIARLAGLGCFIIATLEARRAEWQKSSLLGA